LNTTRRDERLAKEALEEEMKEKNEKCLDDMKHEIAALKTELEEKHEQLEEHAKNTSILHDLFERNIIDKDGNLLQ
jgi:SMC interacting uncharacterized protein involved in chromosome segregation